MPMSSRQRAKESSVRIRGAIERDASFGEAYWSLANLKTFRFSQLDTERMNAQLARSDLDLSSPVQFHFALGKGAEDAGDGECRALFRPLRTPGFPPVFGRSITPPSTISVLRTRRAQSG